MVFGAPRLVQKGAALVQITPPFHIKGFSFTSCNRFLTNCSTKPYDGCWVENTNKRKDITP